VATDTEVRDEVQAEPEIPALLVADPAKAEDLAVRLKLSAAALAKLRELAKAKRVKLERYAEAGATALLEAMVEGGLMLSRTKVDYLAKKLGVSIPNADRLIDVIDGMAENAGAELRFPCDPAWRIAIEEQICKPQCRTFQQVMQDVFEMVLVNSWAYELRFEGGIVPMTTAERAELESLVGGRVSAEALIEALKK
jgi:hypothetical protein